MLFYHKTHFLSRAFCYFFGVFTSFDGLNKGKVTGVFFDVEFCLDGRVNDCLFFFVLTFDGF